MVGKRKESWKEETGSWEGKGREDGRRIEAGGREKEGRSEEDKGRWEKGGGRKGGR